MTYALQTILKLWHPFIPFVTEAIWRQFDENTLLMVQSWPNAGNVKYEDGKRFDGIIEAVSAIRNLRSENNIEPVKKINALVISKEASGVINENKDIIIALARLENLEIISDGVKPEKSVMAVVPGVEIYLPLSGMIDIDKEVERLQKEITQTEKYIATQTSKLANEQFIANAPNEIVEAEKTKLAEAETKAAKLNEQLTNLK